LNGELLTERISSLMFFSGWKLGICLDVLENLLLFWLCKLLPRLSSGISGSLNSPLFCGYFDKITDFCWELEILKPSGELTEGNFKSPLVWLC
jgi:hypothetical protein